MSTSTPPAVEPSIGTLVSSASRDLSALVRAEIELAKVELRGEVKSAAAAGVMFAVAAVFGVFLLFMLLIAFAEGLVAIGLWRWLAYLVVALVLLVLAGVVAFVGLRTVKKVKAPERTLETTKDTIAWVKHPTQQPVSVRTEGGRTASTVPPGSRS